MVSSLNRFLKRIKSSWPVADVWSDFILVSFSWFHVVSSMSAPVSGRKTPVDHGVQIRFINNLHDTGGGVNGQSRKEAPKKASSRYGVAVRVQGIGGQPYVVLKEGEKGDSYGVQLRSQPPAYNSLPRYCLHFLLFVHWLQYHVMC